jgi:limonene-1,2-epoxide hydrolase
MKPGLGTRVSSLGIETVGPYYRAMSAHPTLFEDIDSMEPDRFAQHLSDDVSFRFGNADPVIGRDAVRATWAGFCDAIAGVSHQVIEQWNNGAATIVEATVTYTRKDNSTVSLPVVTIYRGEGEQIDDYRIFMDVAPLFAS